MEPTDPSKKFSMLNITPMTPEEVRDLLTATLHGPLPNATMQRVMATLAAWGPKVEAALRPVQTQDILNALTAALSDNERLLFFEYMQGRYCLGCGCRQPTNYPEQRCQCENDD